MELVHALFYFHLFVCSLQNLSDLLTFWPLNSPNLAEHKYSDYQFEWQHKYTKTEFSTDKIWKAGRAVIKSKKSGWQRLKFIFDKNGKAALSTADHDGTKLTREDDMENRVLAVLAVIATKTPLSIFDNLHMKRYTQRLNSKHRLPYGLERNRIVEVIIDYVSSEIANILEERRVELGEGFILVATDFWTDPHRREQFGALVIDLIATSYYVDSLDKYMFMSKRTAERLGYVSFNCIMFYHVFMSIFYMLIPDHTSNYYVTITADTV